MENLHLQILIDDIALRMEKSDGRNGMQLDIYYPSGNQEIMGFHGDILVLQSNR